MVNKLTPVGSAGFSVVKEARGFKGSDENKQFSQGLILDTSVGEGFLQEIQAEANRLHAKELENAKARGKSVRYAQPVINYKDTDDGRMLFTFKRREIEGAPPVLDATNKPFSGYITREHKLQIAFELRPYVMANIFGVTLKLLAIKVMDSQLTEESAANLFGAAPTAPKPATKPTSSIEDLF